MSSRQNAKPGFHMLRFFFHDLITSSVKAPRAHLIGNLYKRYEQVGFIGKIEVGPAINQSCTLVGLTRGLGWVDCATSTIGLA